MNIADSIGLWKTYCISLDGKEFEIITERLRVNFRGILCISFRPASEVEQLDEDKEIRSAVQYRLLDHCVPPHPIISEAYGMTVEIGQPYLPLRISADAKQLRQLHGFHIEGDYLALTVICRSYDLEPFPVE